MRRGVKWLQLHYDNTATGTGVTAVYGGEICSGSTGAGTITNTGNTPA